jgi:hypothetical protein
MDLIWVNLVVCLQNVFGFFKCQTRTKCGTGLGRRAASDRTCWSPRRKSEAARTPEGGLPSWPLP